MNIVSMFKMYTICDVWSVASVTWVCKFESQGSCVAWKPEEVKVSQKVLGTGTGILFLYKLQQVPIISFTTISLFVGAQKCQVWQKCWRATSLAVNGVQLCSVIKQQNLMWGWEDSSYWFHDWDILNLTWPETSPPVKQLILIGIKLVDWKR